VIALQDNAMITSCQNKSVLVISDSHGREYKLTDILDALGALSPRERVDEVIFLGDGAAGMIERAQTEGVEKLLAVLGNCDGGTVIDKDGDIVPEERIETVCGKRIFMIHGHTYGVKGGIGRAVKRATELGADVLMLGHTHMPIATYLPPGDESFGFEIPKGLYVFNPGALISGSFGILSVSNGNILLSHGKV
jgi:putative phosphoesterase